MTAVFMPSTMQENHPFLLLDEAALIPDDTCYSSDDESFASSSKPQYSSKRTTRDASQHSGFASASVVDTGIIRRGDSFNSATSDNTFSSPESSNEASPVATPVLAVDVATPLASNDAMTVNAYTRPEYLYALIRKPSPCAPTGIFLKRSTKGAVVISRIESNSLVSQTNLQPGDRIMSVNGVSCLESTPRKVGALIREALCVVSITVRNKKGNPCLVSSCVQKRRRHQKCGIAFVSSRGSVSISRVEIDGLFGSSLLMPGHRCCWINGSVVTPGISSRDAAEFVADDNDFVTIVSRPSEAMAMVLACETQSMSLSRVAFGFGLVAGAVTACAGSFR